ncbi:Pr6Pr family membrane protein [Nesterenkonia sp. K-15-9-6]|uniref:Pr6Pr family membrane protein n=1 Tax=Nesterenkonia sp. K-15-9-6 TaxID=3093918 RepID=UPI004044D615
MAEAETMTQRGDPRAPTASRIPLRRLPTSMILWSAMRVLVAVLATAAVVAQFVAALDGALTHDRALGATVGNFFSYFTILSNSAAAVFLAWAGLRPLIRRRGSLVDPPALSLGLACVTSCVLITGAVYNTLLRHLPLPPGSEPPPWSNEVLHLVVPLFVFADLLLGPRRRALPWRALWVMVAFPLLWAIYTMVRGPLVTDPATGAPFWYPYPFMDPGNPDLVPLAGYPGVILYLAGIAAAMIAVSAVVVWCGRRGPGL